MDIEICMRFAMAMNGERALSFIRHNTCMCDCVHSCHVFVHVFSYSLRYFFILLFVFSFIYYFYFFINKWTRLSRLCRVCQAMMSLLCFSRMYLRQHWRWICVCWRSLVNGTQPNDHVSFVYKTDCELFCELADLSACFPSLLPTFRLRSHSISHSA